MPRINISPGKITAIWQFILIIKKFELSRRKISVRSAVEILQNSSLRGGRLPVKESMALATYYKFLKISKEGFLEISSFTRENLINNYSEPEPNVEKIRIILSQIISFKKLHWLAFYNEDVELFKPAIPQNWLELLELANLLEFSNNGTLEWWRALLNKKEEFENEKRNETGALGEELTVDYEINRLKSDGIKNPDLKVKRVSQISSEYGFDIVSLRGNKLSFNNSPQEEIEIEVKSSVLENEELFTFYVTKNEWRKSQAYGESYFFYCWAGISGGMDSIKGPFIIPGSRLKPFIPKNEDESCEWMISRFILNLNLISL